MFLIYHKIGSSCHSLARIYIQMVGRNSSSPYFPVDVFYSGRFLFQRGCTDIFLFKVVGNQEFYWHFLSNVNLDWPFCHGWLILKMYEPLVLYKCTQKLWFTARVENTQPILYIYALLYELFCRLPWWNWCSELSYCQKQRKFMVRHSGKTPFVFYHIYLDILIQKFKLNAGIN